MLRHPTFSHDRPNVSWEHREKIQLTLWQLSSPLDGPSAHLLEGNKKVRPKCIKNYDGSSK